MAAALRRERQQIGLSLAELSQRSGVSRAMLSQIESGKSTPTITVLWQIVTALGVPFSSLLGEPESPAAVVVRRGDARLIRSADGAMTSRPLFPPARDRRSELYELSLAPRGRAESPAHAAGTSELLVVARGKLRLELPGGSFDLGTGDSVEFAADVPHGYCNTGSGTCVAYDIILYR